ncbi:HU family DNA-binding protein [Proteiniphilum sp. UBA5384]|uniref:HU family DNA-binding protein n=1 Tax=Proteiniphilum sp. UBA5384 TaxID=1947279 RepID=UPI0025EB3092|nr:HU family DNA-binding protein [Proteiniphilum sp. UBA5384]
MTYDDLIAEIARRLEWTYEKTSGIIKTIIEVVGTELKMNNPVVIDDFGTLKTDIQPEYIRVNQETKERLLIPPAIEVIFEVLFENNDEDSLFHVGFVPDEALYNDLNSAFSQFEPTPLDEDVQFPGILEIIVRDFEEESDITGLPPLPKENMDEEELLELPILQEEQNDLLEEGACMEADPITPFFPKSSSCLREGPRNNKRKLSVWIPIAGGIAIIMASLFFFKEDGGK